jgi:hypothetical protein
LENYKEKKMRIKIAIVTLVIVVGLLGTGFFGGRYYQLKIDHDAHEEELNSIAEQLDATTGGAESVLAVEPYGRDYLQLRLLRVEVAGKIIYLAAAQANGVGWDPSTGETSFSLSIRPYQNIGTAEHMGK